MNKEDRPTGTVTFLVTDIEQSTRRWEEQPDAMRIALARHDSTLKQAIERNGGWLFKHTGDGVLAAFAVAQSAIDAAIAAQRELDLPVRMGICTGQAEARNDDYYGPPLNRAARIMAAGHGGQVLVAEATAAIIGAADMTDLGEHRLRDLSQPVRLYQVRAEGLKETFPALKSLNAATGNLPAQVTSFFGREKDIADVVGILKTARLVTLTGVGGVGKTRLALQIAGEVSTNYPDGTWLAEMAAVREPSAIAHALAAVLNVAQIPGNSIEESLIKALAGRRLLVVLDNCEHLIEACASLARRMLTQCPQVRILATSREALMVEGEWTWPVAPLNFSEGPESPAFDLFIDRARAVAPDFEPSGNDVAIREICQRLDGIPLAIELAAARTRAMSPVQISDRLNERFRLLTGGMRGALERHQTLRHAVQWSYELLSSAERSLFARLAVFAGGFTAEAAEKVCTGGEVDTYDISDLLDSLVRKSLVTVERSGAMVRYRLLETIRQFGEERLEAIGESAAVQLHHAQFLADDSDARFKVWLSPRQAEAHDWLDREMDNLRSAFRWSKDNAHTEIAAKIASNVGDMARFRLRDEAASWPEEIIAAARATHHRRLAVLLTWAASSAWSLGRLEEAKHFAEEAISLVGDVRFDSFVWAFTDLAFVALLSGDPQRAIDIVSAGAAHPADARDRMCLATQLYMLTMGGQADRARATAQEVVAATRATGIPSSIILSLFAKGAAFVETDAAVALSDYQQATALARQSGNRLFLLLIIPRIAELLARSGDLPAALGSFREMLEDSGGSRDLISVTYGLGNLIVLLERLGRRTAAATLNGALTRIADAAALVPELPNALSRVRDSVGEMAFAAANRRGAAMPVNEANNYALAEIAETLTALAAGGGDD
jgi:predicted ATPase